MTHQPDPPGARPRGRLTRRVARASALGVTGLAAAVLAALVSQASQTGPHPAGLRPAVPLARAAAGPRIVTARTADHRDVVRLAGTGSTARAPYYITIARLGKAATIRRTVASADRQGAGPRRDGAAGGRRGRPGPGFSAGRAARRAGRPPHPVLPAGAAR